MKLGVLLSGGKDSCYALYKASKENEIVCLLSIVSENQESYMFHTPNLSLTKLQAESMCLPLLTKTTKGEKEKELEDLKALIKSAKEKYNIQGIVTGAIASVYQSSRIQKICDELGLKCLNPLWQIDQVGLLHELIENNFEVIISGVAAEPFDDSWLGKKIDNEMIEKLVDYQAKHHINPSGEGGELETFVINAPMFKKKIVVIESEKKFSKNHGVFIIKNAKLE